MSKLEIFIKRFRKLAREKKLSRKKIDLAIDSIVTRDDTNIIYNASDNIILGIIEKL